MKVFYIFITLSSLFLITSCISESKPGKRVLDTFKAMYPEVEYVDWDQEGSYLVANFKINHKETEAWFDKKGYWYMTQIEITTDSLPQPVLQNMNNSKYKYWHIEDVEMVRYHNLHTKYCIEVEKEIQGYPHYLYLVYTNEGVLEKVINYNEQHPEDTPDLDIIATTNFDVKHYTA